MAVVFGVVMDADKDDDEADAGCIADNNEFGAENDADREEGTTPANCSLLPLRSRRCGGNPA